MIDWEWCVACGCDLVDNDFYCPDCYWGKSE